MRLIFFGSPDFAVPSLKKLYETGQEIAAVVTAPDKPRGRGRKLLPTPVKIEALKLHLPILQPVKLNDPDFRRSISVLQPDLNVVVAFRIMPEWLINLPRLGSINLHASLLPKYRGAAPINWALIKGDKKTGLTTFILKKEVDTGDILIQREMAIEENDDFGSLHDRMAQVGADVLLETIDGLTEGRLSPRPQAADGYCTAPKLTRETGRIDWRKPASDIVNLVRGLSPSPGAYSSLGGMRLIILKASAEEEAPQAAAGVIVSTDDRSGIMVASGQGAVVLKRVKPEGRKAMSSVEFSRGYKVKVGDAFTF